MLTPEHNKTWMTLAGDLIIMADKSVDSLSNINIVFKPKQKYPKIVSRNEEWCLLGCYAVWLL
jgi:hypothetical protein